MTKDISRWADQAMFEAEPVDTSGPKVYLLEMTSDPLGSIAALSAMYTGKVTRSKDEVTDEERTHHLHEMQLTKLTTPLESVKLHFMIEGVTRAFTHQLVRNRTSAYAQESMRFAVKEDMPVALPPSLHGTQSEAEIIKHIEEMTGMDFYHGSKLSDNDISRLNPKERQRVLWDRQVASIRATYNELVNSGMPAEDARGLAPTNVLTRINWVTDLRTLIEVLGVRLCTQAQFEWRQVANEIVEAIAGAWEKDRRIFEAKHLREHWASMFMREVISQEEYDAHVAQYHEVTDRVIAEYRAIAGLFRPICYKTGKCEFMSDADRECSIRERVQANHRIGRPSSEWGTSAGSPEMMLHIEPIRPEEWMLDPEAAR